MTAEILAQKQLDAYNQRDIEAFLACYAENVTVYMFPNDLQYTGKDKMRAGYESYFENNPDLHCTLTKRMVLGDIAIDEEEVTGVKNKDLVHAIAIYQVSEGLIQKVWFVK